MAPLIIREEMRFYLVGTVQYPVPMSLAFVRKCCCIFLALVSSVKRMEPLYFDIPAEGAPLIRLLIYIRVIKDLQKSVSLERSSSESIICKQDRHFTTNE